VQRRIRTGRIYLLLCIVGTALPLVPFGAWLADQPADATLPSRFLAELLSTRIGTFFGLDVLVGVSLGLPLYLYERERAGARPVATRE